MKKALLLTALLALLCALTACGSSSSASTNGFRSGSSGSRALKPEAKLALGTIKLEGTRQAVDPKMAAKLIPLWQLLAQLDSSSSSAPQEVTAVVDEIKTTMTAEQLNTIDRMTLSQSDIFTAFQQQAQATGSGGTADPRSAGSASGNRRGGGGGFGFFVGGGPGGGGGFGGGGFRGNSPAGSGATSTQSDAAQAAEAAQARQNAISSLLIDQLIKLLQAKLSS